MEIVDLFFEEHKDAINLVSKENNRFEKQIHLVNKENKTNIIIGLRTDFYSNNYMIYKKVNPKLIGKFLGDIHYDCDAFHILFSDEYEYSDQASRRYVKTITVQAKEHNIDLKKMYEDKLKKEEEKYQLKGELVFD